MFDWFFCLSTGKKEKESLEEDGGFNSWKKNRQIFADLTAHILGRVTGKHGWDLADYTIPNEIVYHC